MTDVERGSVFAIAVLTPVLFGYFAQFLKATVRKRVLYSALPVVAVVLAHWLSLDVSAGVRLLLIAWLLMLGMKAFVAMEEKAAGRRGASLLPWLLYMFAWVGTSQSEFYSLFGNARYGWLALCLRGSVFLILGIATWCVGAHVASINVSIYLVGAFALIAFVFTMHVGLLNVCAGVWRLLGADVGSVLRNPVAARSLQDFWGARWNLPFTYMLRRSVLKPMRKFVGKRGAIFGSFLVSGVLHDVALSLPVRAGYGLPTLYFAIQGGLVAFEDRLRRRGVSVDAGWWRAWTYLGVLAPLPLLFHEPFLRGVVLPLFEGM